MSTDLQRSLAMFRFNFWAKPFFPPPPGGGGLDNSPFVPSPLTSPALMVLASTAAAEGHDGQSRHLQTPPQHGQHHPSFPGQRAMDKDLPPPPPPPPFSTAAAAAAAFMYRPGDPFSAPLYSPLPFARPDLDRRLALMNPTMRAGSGAFRPLGPSCDGDVASSQSYHSAFSPASSTPSSSKKFKSEEASTSSPVASGSALSEQQQHNHQLLSSSSSSSASYREEQEELRDGSPSKQHSTGVVKEERPPSLASSQGYDTVSEPLSDSGDAYERGTPDSEGRSLRKQRKRASHDGQMPCCPVCGLTLRAGELGAHLMLEIDKLDKLSRGGRKSRDTTPQGRKGLTSPSGSRKGKESPPPEVSSRSRYDTFLRVRCNRQSRLSVRRGQKKRRPGEDGPVKETLCPICNDRLTGSTEELNAHVELCLRKRNGTEEEEEPVDVEGEFEEYEWAGQTRVRATSMLEGGFSGSGFQMSKKGSDEDAELDVDGDDTEAYGKPQFSDKDIVPLGAEVEESDIGSSASATFPSVNSFASRTDVVNSEVAGCSSSFDPQNCDEGSATQSTPALISALRLKLRDLEAEKAEKQKCLICMEPYKTPLTSIQCWHVHCENCWMKTLGAKKLCPQCNMITSPSDLRRIYL